MIKRVLEGFLEKDNFKAHEQCGTIGIVFLVGHRNGVVPCQLSMYALLSRL